jgi:signal transduction protein with GAF and PtsI domain
MDKKIERKFYLKEFKAIIRAISTYEDLNLLFKHVTEGLSNTFDVKGCCIMLHDDREQQLFCVSSFGISEDYLTKGPIFADDKHSAFFTGKPVFVDDLQNDPRMQYTEAAEKEGFVTLLSFPIRCRQTVIGLIRMYNNEHITLHEDDIESICILAEQLGLLIENNGLKNFLDGVKVAMDNLPLRMLQEL